MDLAAFRQRVAQRLGVLSVAEPLSAEDGELIGQGYNSLLAELGEHQLCWWGTDEDVPDQYADVLIGMVAASLVNEYETPDPLRSEIVGDFAFGRAPITTGERRLRAMMRVGSDWPTEIEYL